jgi:predicted ATPase
MNSLWRRTHKNVGVLKHISLLVIPVRKKPWKMFTLFKKGLTIEFNEGVNVIVGENGSGKSTLFHLIKNYAGTAPDRLSRALSDCKTDEGLH